MARPSKSIELIEKEGKSHRTKAEIDSRKKAEAAALTGLKLHEAEEVKADPVAHKEFRRIIKILTAVGKNDALYEAVINEYCLIKSDIERYTRLRSELEEADIDSKAKFELIITYDNRIDKYKKRRFDIEKENGMTIASSLRAIPKKPEPVKNHLLEALNES